jgi:sugar phosphate isomerase/epimerase
MQRSQLAINSISTKHRDLPEALAAYSADGFRNVEFHLPLVKEWLAAGHSVDDVRGLLERHHLQSIGGFETHVECFTAAASRDANRSIHLANAELIDRLGGGTLVVGTDGPPTPSVEALDTVAEVFGELATAMDGLNVAVALEFNWSPLVRSVQSAAIVCARAQHPRVGMLFDPAHYYVSPSKFEHLTAETIRWIKHVHVDDMRDKPGELSHCNSDRVLPGEGVVDLPTLLGAIEEHGYRGYFSIELFNAELWAQPVVEASRRCYESLIPLCRPDD